MDLAQQLVGVLGVHGAAVLDGDALSSLLTVQLGDNGANIPVYLVGLFAKLSDNH